MKLISKTFLYILYILEIGRYKSDRGFIKIHNGSMVGNHWGAIYVKNNKSFYFDSFGGAPDKFIPNHLPEAVNYHNYKIQDINTILCGSYCL